MGRLEPGGFKPEYEGDNPNRKWVRDKLAERGTPADTCAIVLVLPKAQIDWLFDRIVQHSYYEIEG